MNLRKCMNTEIMHPPSLCANMNNSFHLKAKLISALILATWQETVA